jgi:hypothetical protein
MAALRRANDVIDGSRESRLPLSDEYSVSADSDEIGC